MYSDSYSLIQRLLHWTIAILIMCLLGVGFFITFFADHEAGISVYQGLSNAVGGEMTNLLYKYHKTFGVVLLGLMVLRLICRLLIGKPAYSEPLPLHVKLASSGVHIALYLALFAMPIVGWAATAAGGYPVEFFDMKMPGFLGKDPALSELLYEVHEILAWVILGLAALHIAGAMFHWIVRRDSIMGRMSLF